MRKTAQPLELRPHRALMKQRNISGATTPVSQVSKERLAYYKTKGDKLGEALGFQVGVEDPRS